MRPVPFSMTVQKGDEEICVTCSGEFDLAVADRFRDAIDAVLHEQPRRLHFECSGIEFIDSIGMRAFMHTATRCRDARILMTIDMSPRMRQVFDTVGVTALFNPSSQAPEVCAESDAVPV